MDAVTTWTAFGARLQRPRPSTPGIVLALFFALPVMTDVAPQYPAYMIALAILAAGYFTWLGVRARALVSLLLIPVALLWLNPLLGADWFTTQGAAFFLPHAALAMLFGIAAYTFAATEKR